MSRITHTNPLIAQRLTQLRKQNGYTQKDVLALLSDMTYETRKASLSPSVISQWEQGRRTPAPEMVKHLAKIYQVTTDYIMGADVGPQEKSKTPLDYSTLRNMQPNGNIGHTATVIPRTELNLFDGLPVYIYFNSLQHSDQWGIVNYNKGILVLKNGNVDFSDPTIKKICTDRITYGGRITNCSNVPLDYSRLLSCISTVWVEVTSPDEQLQSLYNGWYHHNENNTCLINALGLTLPYEGIQISYNAYTRRVQ